MAIGSLIAEPQHSVSSATASAWPSCKLGMMLPFKEPQKPHHSIFWRRLSISWLCPFLPYLTHKSIHLWENQANPSWWSRNPSTVYSTHQVEGRGEDREKGEGTEFSLPPGTKDGLFFLGWGVRGGSESTERRNTVFLFLFLIVHSIAHSYLR